MSIYAVNGKAPIAAWIPSLDTAGNGTTTLTDLVGSNNGTLTNMDAATDWVTDTGAGGVRALDFDGVNDHITSSLSLNNAGGFAISLWQRFDAYTTLYPAPICVAMSASGGVPFFLFWSTVTNYEGLNIGAVLYFPRQRVNTTVTAGAWQHVVVTCSGDGVDAGDYTVYLDGVAMSLTTTGAYSTVSNATRIGTTGGSITYFDGRIDDIRIFDQALDAADVSALYAAGNGRGITFGGTIQTRRRRDLGGFGL